MATHSAPLGAQPNPALEIERRVSEFSLPNGMRFLVLPRGTAPVVALHLTLRAGSADDPPGKAGISHLLEHLAFKGTQKMGSRNWPAEQRALEAVEAAYDALASARRQDPDESTPAFRHARERFEQRVHEAEAQAEPNRYGKRIEENGGVNLNANTGADLTHFYCSLPRDKLELWFALESDRFLNPVFRDFYRERDVVVDEMRMRADARPQSRLLEAFRAAAFRGGPYDVPANGARGDLSTLRPADAEAFWRAYYVPNRITVAIAGDVDPARVKRLANRYFGRLRPVAETGGAAAAAPVPQQESARVETDAQPLLLVGYHRPARSSPDDAAYELLGSLLGGGRSSLLATELVQKRGVAVSARCWNSFPGGRLPHIFLMTVTPAPGHTAEENEQALALVLESLRSGGIDGAALERARSRVRGALLNSLDSSPRVAWLLAQSQALHGDWRRPFRLAASLETITASDIRQLARRTFTPAGRVAAVLAPRAVEARR